MKNEEKDFMLSEKDRKELLTIGGILDKFSDELADAKSDEKRLLALPKSERTRKEYQAAWTAVQERKADLELSIKLLRSRRDGILKGKRN